MPRLRAWRINISTGGPKVVILNEDTATRSVIKAMDRVRVIYKGKSVVAIVNLSENIPPDKVGLYEEVWRELGVDNDEEVIITLESRPKSLDYIRKKMDGFELNKDEMFSIVQDIIHDRLSDIEIMAFIVSSYTYGLSFEEAAYLTEAIVETGEKLELNKYPIADKHCIGGVPNNRTTMLVVPIIASLGIHIPKTSSRAITSPAGTADTMEVLAPVDLTVDEMKNVVLKTYGCIAWGGGTGLAAADDKMIRLRRSLSLDPEGMVLASVLAKKKAVGATHLIIDIPYGPEAKIKNVRDAYKWKMMFEKVSKMLGIKPYVVITDGSQPIGRGMGPALEARDVLWILNNSPKGPMDLMLKGATLAGLLLEHLGVVKKGRGELLALEIIRSGKALEKMKEIIEAQGGDPNIKPEDIPIGEYTYDVYAERNGMITYISNHAIAKISRYAGAPKDKGAGIYLYKKKGDYVKVGEKLMTIYSESEKKLDDAIKIMEEEFPFKIE